MKKPLIILPFWCQDEVDQFCYILEHWDTLTKTKLEYEFQLVSRFDFEGDSTRLKSLCEIYATTSSVRLPGKMTGHPAGCNEMWANTMRYLSVRDDISFAFWMECDIVPQDRNWLNWLYDRWSDGLREGKDLYLMGHYVSNEWLRDNGYPDGARNYPIPWGAHINGAGCYDCKKMTAILDKHEFRIDMGWDAQLLHAISSDLSIDIKTMLMPSPKQVVDALTMYELRLGHTNYIRDENLMMVHGAKTAAAKQEIVDDVRKRDLPTVIQQHSSPFNADMILQGTVYGLLKAYGVKTAIETGSFVGTTTKWLSDNVDLCYGIEVQEEFWEKAKANAPDSQVILGSSIEVLPQILEEIDKGPVFFFLDSHWKNEWPLLDELRIIGESKWAKNCIIVIHDYKVGKLGYDSYDGQDLDGNYVKSALETYFKDAKTFTNKDAVGYKRGVLCIINVGEQSI